MMRVVIKSFDTPPIDEKEVLRYAGAREGDEASMELAKEMIDGSGGLFCFKVCFLELPFKTDGRLCDFSAFSVESKKLAKCLCGSSRVLVFAATVGVGVDRAIAKYSRIAPSKAFMLSALGAERIEALCDAFCREYAFENNVALTPRFSSGYGDCPLDVQRQIFDLLDCPKNIGLTLNDSMLMSPTKSVTAFVGIKEK